MNRQNGSTYSNAGGGVMQNGGATQILTPKFLCFATASTLYWIWMFLFYWSSSLYSVFSTEISLLLRGCALLGSAILLLLAFIAGKKVPRLFKTKFFGVLFPVACSLFTIGICIGAHVFGTSFPSPLLCAAWFCGGMSIAVVLILMGKAMVMQPGEETMLSIVLTLLLSCITCIFLLRMPPIAMLSVLAIIPLASILIVRRLFSRYAKDGNDPSSAGQKNSLFNSIKAKLEYRTLIFQQAVFSTLFSLGQFFCLIYAVGVVPEFFNVFGAGLFIAGLLSLAYGAWLNRYISIPMIELILLFIICISVILTSLVPSNDQLIIPSCVLMSLGFTCFDVLSLYQLVRIITVNKLPFVRYFSLGRLANAVGLVLGCTIVCLCAYAFGGLSGSAFRLEYVAAAAILLAIGYFVFFETRRDRKLNKDFDASGTKDISPPSELGYWRSSLNSLSDEFRLSPREREVFMYLSRGRSIPFICDSLFISPSTVKTHSGHIYRKLGVKDQQELISMVEEKCIKLKRLARSS